MKIIKYLVLLFVIITFITCKSGPDQNSSLTETEEDNTPEDSLEDINYVLISPSEIFEYIFFEELTPDPQFVNPHTNAVKYITSTKMALNLGVYTTDFIYLNLCSDKQQVLNYYKVILEIAPKINIYSGAEDNLPERLQKHFAIHDSVSELSKQVYYKILEDLEQEGRQKTYSLIAGGVIIESVYLAAMNIKNYSVNKTLTEKLFEQKEFLNNTYNFIASNERDKDIEALLNQLEELKNCFEEIGSTNEKVKVKRNNEGKLQVEGGIENIISTSDLEKLKKVATKIRNEIISDK